MNNLLDEAVMSDRTDRSSSSGSGPLSDAEYEQLAERCEDMELDAVWLELSAPLGSVQWMARSQSFDVRKHAFLWVVRRLVLDGRIMLVHAGRPAPGSLDEQIEAMNAAFPTSDEAMEDGIWFHLPACPFGGNWRHKRMPH